MSIQENTLVFRRSLLHLVVIGSIIHQSISFFITRAQHDLVSSSTMCNPLARSAGVYLLAKIGADTAENE